MDPNYCRWIGIRLAPDEKYEKPESRRVTYTRPLAHSTRTYLLHGPCPPLSGRGVLVYVCANDAWAALFPLTLIEFGLGLARFVSDGLLQINHLLPILGHSPESRPRSYRLTSTTS